MRRVVVYGWGGMDWVDLAFTPALEQAGMIRRGELSPLELTEMYLERIGRLDGQLGSFFTVMGDRAREDAQAKTEQLAQSRSEDLPPFFGVPISIKDLVPVAGVPCSYGVRVLRDRLAEIDAGVVTRLKEAGFVLLGKTATAELGAAPFTEPRGFPPARNPWNPDYTPGGSSGGAAASVAAGFCSVAQATDGAGSVRGPAYCCGLVGIKPSRGRISHAPLGDKLSGLVTDGPLARTVADAAALLDVMSGYLPGDPYWLPQPKHSFQEATQKPLGPLRVGFLTEIPPMGQADAVCTDAVMQMVHRLEKLGYKPEPVELDCTELVEPLITIWQSGVDMGVPWFLLGKVNRWLLRRARRTSGGKYLRAVMQLQTVARKMATHLAPYDVVVMPVYLHHTIRVGEWAKFSAAQIFDHMARWVAPAPAANAMGVPAIALPTGFAPDGLPTGVQLMGRPADEITLIALAAQVEAAYPWQQHRPALVLE